MNRAIKEIKSCEDTIGGCFKEEEEEKKEDNLINPELLSFEQRTGLKIKPTGLGDRVEKIAQPIAKMIDKVAGTNIQGCGACKKRKEYLNEKFPTN